MPIFIDEIIIRGEVSPSPVGSSSDQAAAAEAGGADRQLLVSEVTEAVIEHLERVLERIGER